MESLYEYLLYRLEEQGAYFYFAPDEDKIIFADAPESHDTPLTNAAYSPGTGLEVGRLNEIITSFSLQQSSSFRKAREVDILQTE